MPYTCFLIEDSGINTRWLRRFTFSGRGRDCPSSTWGHDAKVRIEDLAGEAPSGDLWPHDDPRWPKTCAVCGGAFDDADEWQIFYLCLYRMPDGRLVHTHPAVVPGIDAAPAGAMWVADWLGEADKGPDGHAYLLQLPNGAHSWSVYGPSSPDGAGRSGPKWTVTGTPPCLTASPSIHAVGQYHGWLQNGVLSDG